MFTGLIEDVGKISAVRKIGGGVRFSISSDKLNDLEIDDSIAVNGCCLTAVAVESNVFEAEAVEETLKKTTLGGFSTGTEVNLERAMRLSDRLGGHLVLGHVDGVGHILSVEERSTSWWVTVEVPSELERYLIHVGSIAIDGISLTIAELAGNIVSVSIIPHTWTVTNLARRQTGDLVNIEVDMIGKYVDKLLLRKAEPGSPPRITEEFLKEKGFMHV
ncbi:riboflavin synthase [bacterium]|nr:riboflavin synthase [bacterium]